MSRKAVPGAVLVGALVSFSPARAQVGSGWTSYTPNERLQTRGCGAHGAAGGVQTFRLTCADASSDNRAEQRIENDYSTGTRQFEGEVRVVSLGGSNISLKQTFMPDNGAFLMIGVAGNGRLYSVGDGGELATGIIGRWVRINTIHDVAAGTHEMYVDGTLKVTKRGGRQVAWHDKYGTYRLGSGQGPIVAEWRNVRYWRDGRSTGGVGPPPPADAGAGAPDASVDSADGPSPADGPGPADRPGPADGPGQGGSGTGGVGGSGGSGGMSGAGGTGGAKGLAGAGGAPIDDPPPLDAGSVPARSAAGGCATGGVHSPGGVTVAALLALAARLGRRRRSARPPIT